MHVRKIVKRASSCLSVSPSVGMEQLGPHRTDFYEILNIFSKNLLRKFKVNENRKRITGNLHDSRYTFLITSLSSLLRTINVPDKSFREH